MAIIGIFLGLIIAAVAIGLYIIYAFALMTMANKRGIENSWLAFIPIANFYIMGLLIGPFKLGGYDIDKPELYLPLAFLACSFLGRFPLIGGLMSLLSLAVAVVAFYFLYKRYTPENAVLFAALTIVPFVTPFLLLSIKDREPIDLQ